jgi:hypothetical protein
LAVALAHCGATGVPIALACSGGFPGAGWEYLDVADAYPLQRVSIATDGFVLLKGVYREELDAKSSLPWIRVTDAAGDQVAGHARVLRTEPYGDATDDRTTVYIAWQAERTLTVGAVLRFSWADDSEGGGEEGGAPSVPAERASLELEVVGEPPSLPTASVTLGAWADVRHGVGERVACEIGDSCGTAEILVQTHETRLKGVHTAWEVPEFSGMVAWKVRAAASDAADGDEARLNESVVVARNKTDALDKLGTADRHIVDLGYVTFAPDATDHCVVVIIEDLRTGEQSRSEPRCASPREPEREVFDYQLASCNEPPTAESAPLWCEGRVPARDCPPAGEGDAGASGKSGSGHAGEAATNDDAPLATRASPTGGCQLAPTTGRIGLVGLMLGALALIARRRRASAV